MNFESGMLFRSPAKMKIFKFCVPQGDSHPQGARSRCYGHSDDVLQAVYDAGGGGCGHSFPRRICTDEELVGTVCPPDRNVHLDLSLHLPGNFPVGYALHRLACVEGSQ